MQFYQLKQQPAEPGHGQLQIEIYPRPRRGGQTDGSPAQLLRPAFYAKKSASFTAFFSFSSSRTGSPRKNASGSLTAMPAMIQA